jgi:hypothetical protein
MPKKKNPFKLGTCVAPVGLTLPCSKARLESLPKGMRAKDAQHIMMRLWAKENVRQHSISFGKTPVDAILHRCNDQCGVLCFGGTPGHHYIPPDENEVQVINATVQWLAGNQGRALLHKFFQELKRLNC